MHAANRLHTPRLEAAFFDERVCAYAPRPACCTVALWKRVVANLMPDGRRKRKVRLSHKKESSDLRGMKKHLLSLRYDGLDAATHHGIGTAGSKQVIGGAQILLGAHAHYFVGGKVPDRVDDRGEGFKVLDVGRRQGSIIFDIALLLTANAIWDVPNGHYGFDRFLAESYAAHRVGRLFEEPPFERRQLGAAARANEYPVRDLDYARDYERRRLLQRTQQAVSFISAPLGITASLVEVSIDGNRIDTMRARQPGANNINEWLQAFRQGNVGSSRFQ